MWIEVIRSSSHYWFDFAVEAVAFAIALVMMVPLSIGNVLYHIALHFNRNP